MCHGAIESLKANPMNMKINPNVIAGFIALIFIISRLRLPVTPYMYATPVRNIPVEKEAKMRYLNEASRLNFPLPKAIKAIIGNDESSRDKYIVMKSTAIITKSDPINESKIKLINSDTKEICLIR
tara:strand:+ start:1573 stop:1950 length:378 start_codon:yes stop_codon:yes gene_type:complete